MQGSPWENEANPPLWLDTGIAHSARVWNYLLGGKDNFAADREAGDMIARIFPDASHIVRVQRRFLVRAVRYLAAEAGIRQFLDVGVGLPAADGTHQVAQQIAPESRIVYADNDPLVLVHARALLTSAPGGVTSYVEADVRDSEEILQQAAQTLDFSQPIAVLMLGVLGQLADADSPHEVVAGLLASLPGGSYLVASDSTDTSPEQNDAMAAYNALAANAYCLRSPQQIAGFFDGLTLVPPGVVAVSQWQPDLKEISSGPPGVAAVAGVGRKD